MLSHLTKSFIGTLVLASFTAAPAFADQASTFINPAQLPTEGHPASIVAAMEAEAAAHAENVTNVSYTYFNAAGNIRDTVQIDLKSGAIYKSHLKYNEKQQLIRIERDNNWTDYAYDSNGNQVLETTSYGLVNGKDFDSHNRQIYSYYSYPGNDVVTSDTVYSADGLKSVETKSNGIVIENHFDDRGNSIYYKASYPGRAPTIVERSYNEFNKIASVKLADHTNYYNYDEHGNQISFFRDDNLISKASYDEQSREVLFTAVGYLKQTLYDDTALTKESHSRFFGNGSTEDYLIDEFVQYDAKGRESYRSFNYNGILGYLNLFFYDAQS